MEDWPPLLAGDIRLEDGFSSPQSTLHPALRPPGAAASIGEVNDINIMAMMIAIIFGIIVIKINILITTLALSPLWREMWGSGARRASLHCGTIICAVTICVFHSVFLNLDIVCRV